MTKGYYTGYSYAGYVNEKIMYFATEEEYEDYIYGGNE